MATHGMSKTRFYNVWNLIISKCNNPKNDKFNRYGERGIKCEWKCFEDFKKDMYVSYKKHLNRFGILNTTIERIDNNGNYCRENCRWATRKEQARNRHTTCKINFNGKTQSIVEWAEETGITRMALWLRIKRRKWSIEKALKTPLRSS